MISGYSKKSLIADLNRAYFNSLTDADHELAKRYDDIAYIDTIYSIEKMAHKYYVIDTNKGPFTFTELEMSFN